MRFEVEETEDGVIVAISGILKKLDAMQLANEIAKVTHSKPKKLALDFSELSALSLDSVPFIVSAIERARLGKQNVRAFGYNSMVGRALRSGNFERVGTLE